jgi:hypothetical protein
MTATPALLCTLHYSTHKLLLAHRPGPGGGGGAGIISAIICSHAWSCSSCAIRLASQRGLYRYRVRSSVWLKMPYHHTRKGPPVSIPREGKDFG